MIIQDKLLGKYEIKWDDTFTVIENGVAIDAKTGEGKPKQSTIGYFGTLNGALRKICKLLVQESSEVASLKEVIERFDALWEKIDETIKI